MTPSHREADVSAYLREPSRPMPQWLGGERVRFPGQFGFSVAKRPVWDSVKLDWIYAWEGDEQERIAA